MLPSFAAMAPNHVYTTWQLPRGLCIVFGQNVDSARLYPNEGKVQVGDARTIPTPIGGGPRLLLPAASIALLAHCAPLFSRRTWRHVPILVAGARLAPGRRMVSSALRAVGLAHVSTFPTDHRVLNRERWSSRGVSRILFGLLVTTFAPHGPLVVGVDEPLERRRSKKMRASGISRDPVRSSHRHFVKGRGLRWMCALLLVPIPSRGQIGSGPCPSSRCWPPRSVPPPASAGDASRSPPGHVS
jgi:hypothetical protein